MRDKLIELIESCRYWGAGTSAEIADHLIANNVFVLPEKMKDSWELALPFMMRLFGADEEEIEKIKGEFDFSQKKQILTDIRDYLVEKAELVRERDMEFLGQSAMLQLLAIEQKELIEYAEKLGVEL